MAEKKERFRDGKKRTNFSFSAIKAYFKSSTVKSETTNDDKLNENQKEKSKIKNAKKVKFAKEYDQSSGRGGLNQNDGEDMSAAGINNEFKIQIPTYSQSGRLYYGKALYHNSVHVDQETPVDMEFDYSKTIADVIGLNVPKLVSKAEVGNLTLDDRSLEKLKERFVSMPRLYKRQFYLCGERYIIPEQMSRWSEQCKKFKAKPSSIGRLPGDSALNSKIALIHGDIASLEVDAVINSVSNFLTEWDGGVSKSIYRAATVLIFYELESIAYVDVGDVVATSGYLLPAKYVFHTSGPMYGEQNLKEKLKKCYRKCLDRMVQMKLRTLAFSCISTGAKQVDSKQAAMIALTTVKEWLQINMHKVEKIIFCIYDKNNWACYQRLMPDVFPAGDNIQSTDDDQNSLIPVEILRMDKNSIELYKRALSEGKDAVYNIRVMVVGHYGVGKTTLTKRLFGEEVDINQRESTNGIDVHVRRCKVSLETGQWNIVEKDQKTDSVCHCLVNLLKRPHHTDEAVGVDDDKAGCAEDDESAMDTREDFDVVDGFISSENKGPDISDICAGIETEFDDTEPEETVQPLKEDTAITENFSTLEEAKDENILRYLEDLIDDMRHSGSTHDSNMADVSVWDFAGQYAFYATHQVFLSRRAVYLLVTDISKHVEDIVKDDDCFLDSKGVKQWKISEFVEFWLNSIHEFCGSAEDGGPPVLLVGTFADKLEKDSKTETIDEFFYTLRCSLLDKVTSCHLIEEDFAIDNTIIDSNMDLLKHQIVKTASEQSYWGELIPVKWITLENMITGLKNKGTKILTKDMLRHLNNTLPVPIETDEEMELFLRFHHDSGNILYYCDRMLNDSIVLDPQWLIDAFKSLITAKMFCCRKPEILKKWIQFDQSAILTRELVEAIWSQNENSEFHTAQNLLLNYLEKLGFIAKPHQSFCDTDVPDYYFAPCVLKYPPTDGVLDNEECKDNKCTSKLCLTTELRFLPTAVFNKLLSACINKWPLAKMDKKHLIFCGCAIFDLEENHTLYVYFFDHVIQIWITKFSTQNEEPSKVLCCRVYAFVLDVLTSNLNLSNHVTVFFRCRSSEHHSNENMFSEEELLETAEILCNCRARRHVLQTNELTKYWQSAVEEINPASLTDKDINRIAQNIGKEYETLAIELGLSQAEIDHINLDSKTAVDRIRRVLLRWRDKMKVDATLDTLSEAMKAIGIDPANVIETAAIP